MSIGTSSPNSSICNGNVTILSDSVALLNLQFSNNVYDEAARTLNKMAKAINPVAFACYYSLFEFIQIGKDYFFTVQDMNKLAYNLIHNLGNLYDNVVDIIDLTNSMNTEDVLWWGKAGHLLGDTIS